MNSTASTRRIIRILTALAITGTTAFAFGFALNALALPLFALTASALTVLVLARDYAPRSSYLNDVTARAALSSPARERMALAA